MRNCLICDDHALMRDALAGAVGLSWPDAAVTLAPDFPSAWAAAAAEPRDLILSDLTMPGADPLEGVRRLRALAPDTPVLVVTGNEDDALLLALFDLGIAGFVPKTAKAEVIEAAIRLVLAGERYLPPRLLGLIGGRTHSASTVAVPTARLTGRQAEILERMAAGESNKTIARALDLSPSTVKTHAAAAFAALGAANRTEAVVRARALKLI
ncbi:response regulator [Sphingomonas tabacisoli]|uniref:Response regulator n=1 Tax=Sphingomonas tabacisoli TaxID=2249466 RepID=A0ABW4I6B8_9SPHN